MAWTVPRRWAVNETVTAALLNTHLRDNLNATETATVTTAGDTVYATAKNTLTRLAAGSARTALTVASGGTTPEWAHSFYPIDIATSSSMISTSANWGETHNIYTSPNVGASFLAANSAVFFTFFFSVCNPLSSTLEIDFSLRSGGSAAGNVYANLTPFPAGSTTAAASLRGAWYSAWVISTATCINCISHAPRNASLMPILGAVSDVYFQEKTALLSGTTFNVQVGYLFSSSTNASMSACCHYAGIWGVRAI